ncbi:MAG: 3-hydroxyacyl-ACP dehydratase FabZ [Pseudoxanthomonas sp.]|jgi:3-hydroxyacyl-[acyl-carrier-protein] dehydratase
MNDQVQVQLPIRMPELLKLLPHRYPFLLIDKVVELDPHKRIKAIKNVTVNEPFFQGHFPGHPVMPGVLVIEALAQAGGILTQVSRNTNASDREFYLVKIEGAKFSRMVVPGDVLELNVEIKRVIRNMTFYSCVARVDGEQAACCEVLCAETTKKE